MLLRREQIRWEHIDPRVTAKVGAYIAQTRGNDASAPLQHSKTGNETTNPHHQAVALSGESLGPGWTILSCLGALFLVFLYLNAFFNLTGPVATAMLTALPVGVVGIGTMAGVVERGRVAPVPRLRGSVAPLNSGLRQAFTEAATTRAEKLYTDIVLHLATFSPTLPASGVAVRREMLRECNSLLADHFKIEVHRQRIIRLIDNGTALEQAEREESRLRSRRDAEADPIARRSFTESLELCSERVEAVRGLSPLLIRLEAHDELICQALSLAQTALARTEAAPVALQAPDVEKLRNTVRRVLHQTHAMEEAIAELSQHVP